MDLLMALPPELFWKVVSLLPLADVVTLGQLNRLWRLHARDPDLWKRLKVKVQLPEREASSIRWLSSGCGCEESDCDGHDDDDTDDDDFQDDNVDDDDSDDGDDDLAGAEPPGLAAGDAAGGPQASQASEAAGDDGSCDWESVSTVYHRLHRVVLCAGYIDTVEMDFRYIGPDEIRAIRDSTAPVRRLSISGSHMDLDVDDDPKWLVKLLHRLAPHLEELKLSAVTPAQFGVLHEMPRLRRLHLDDEHSWAGGWQRVSPPVVMPPLPPGHAGLEWLWLQHLPLATTRSLVRAHAATLRHMLLYVGGDFEGDRETTESDWPLQCRPSDLAELLKDCKALELWVRGRRWCHGNCEPHRDAVRAVLRPGAQALCGECEYDAQADFEF